MGDPPAGEFLVTILGKSIACKSLRDAVDVKAAADILSGDDPTPYTPREITRLAGVLARLGRPEAARRLNSVADQSLGAE